MVQLKTTTKKTLTTKAYETIHSAICSGTLPPGALLSENDLSRQLGMSRTPIREALRILESQDFVEIRDGLGTFVKTLNDWEIRDLYEIRTCLETMAASTAIDFIKKRDIDRLERQFLSLLDRHAQGAHIDFAEFTEIDSQLHYLIINNCQNKYVTQFMQSILSNVKRCQLISATYLDDLEESTKQHLILLEHIRAKDKEALVLAMTHHLKWSMRALSS